MTPAGSSPAELNLGAIIVAGGTAGVAMWAIAIPPDVGFHFPSPSVSLKKKKLTGFEITLAIGTNGNVFGLDGLRAQDHSSRRRSGTLERLWACDGQGKYTYNPLTVLLAYRPDDRHSQRMPQHLWVILCSRDEPD